MELRKIIRTDIAASAIAHLTLVALIIVISEVHPFHAAPPETVAVDIVTPEQVKQDEAKAEEKAKEKPSEPSSDLKLPKLDFTDREKPDTSSKPVAREKAPPQQKQAAHEAQGQRQQKPQAPLDTRVHLETAQNLTTDAHLAALAVEHGATIAPGTGTSRFDGVRPRLPG